MKKQHLAARLARLSGISKAAAADRIDREIHQILSGLKKGKPVLLPGLGELTAIGNKGVEFTSAAPRGSMEKRSGKQR